MHISFLEYLQCPRTQEELQLTNIEETKGDFVVTAVLASSKYEYPVVRGIPRFAGWPSHNYAKSFGYQWLRWARLQFESENVNTSMAGHTTNMFEKITNQKNDNYSGQTILDVGCGPGRFIEVARMKKAKVIGIDYSDAVEAAYQNFAFDDKVLICQADALNLPIKQKTIDGAYSIGVLHHTPAPEKGFNQMVKVVQPNGWVAISVYGKGGYYDSPRVTVWRTLFKALSPLFGYLPPLIYSYLGGYVIYPLTHIPLLGHLLRLVYPTIRLPDRRWRVLDTFDSVTPTYQSSHESFEVFKWFKAAGLVDIEPSDWAFTSYHGKVGL